jgi:exodeoxyribonuclease III
MLRVVCYNLLEGFQNRPERKRQTLSWIADRKPDVLALQELNGYTPEHLAQEAREWGHSDSVLLKLEGYPCGLTSNKLMQDPQRLVQGFQKGVVYARTHNIDVFVVHHSVAGWEARLSEAALIIARAKAAMQAGRHTLVLGDFNALSRLDQDWYAANPGVREYQWACDQKFGWRGTRNGELDYSVMESYSAAGLADVVAQRTQGPRDRLSYPTLLLEADAASGNHLGRSARLDYILASPELAERCRHASVERTDGTAMQSDHYPLLAEFDI